jgi:dCTP deaminase
MILPDYEILKYIKSGKLVIEPLDNPELQIQSACIDLRLGNEFRIFKVLAEPFIDIKDDRDYTELVHISDGNAFILHPREFVIGITKERIKMPKDLVGYIDGRSSLGRLGITAHITSSFVDPTFDGKLALEISNLGKMPVKLYPGMRICKLIFFKLTGPAKRPYSQRPEAKYKNHMDIVPSKIAFDFKNLKG